MIKDIRLVLKLTQFSLQHKSMKIFMIFFIICGVLFELFANRNMSNLGGFYLVMTPMYLYNMLTLNEISSYYRTAPILKTRILRGRIMLNSLFSIIMMTVFVIMRVTRILIIRQTADPLMVRQSINVIIVLAIMSLILDLYSILVYKKYILTLIGFLIIFIPSIILFGIGKFTFWGSFDIPLPVVLLITYLIMFVKGFATYGVALASYRVPVDKLSYKNALQNASK